MYQSNLTSSSHLELILESSDQGMMYKCRLEDRGGIGFGKMDVNGQELEWYLYDDLSIADLAGELSGGLFTFMIRNM